MTKTMNFHVRKVTYCRSNYVYHLIEAKDIIHVEYSILNRE